MSEGNKSPEMHQGPEQQEVTDLSENVIALNELVGGLNNSKTRNKLKVAKDAFK